MDQFFDTIGGLPLHPLSVHAAAVIIPASAIALLVLVFVPRWRKTYLPLTVASLALSVVLAFVAKESGEQLAARVGTPAEHQELGDLMLPVSAGMFLLGLAFYILVRTNKPKMFLTVAGALGSVAVFGVVALSVLVGHSGAEATWGSKISSAQAEELPAEEITAEGSGITAAEISKHSTAKDCWSVIDGNVYDLSGFLPTHQGGASVIEAICGKDGTKAFNSQHMGENKPQIELEPLLVGAYFKAAGEQSSSETAMTSEEVALHTTAKDCWSVVDGVVYDLTGYVTDHPGGSAIIKELCGKDATASFASEHAGASQPLSVLAAFEIGKLQGSSQLPEATVVYGDEDEDEEEEDDD